jgi:hypothetical protein
LLDQTLRLQTSQVILVILDQVEQQFAVLPIRYPLHQTVIKEGGSIFGIVFDELEHLHDVFWFPFEDHQLDGGRGGTARCFLIVSLNLFQGQCLSQYADALTFRAVAGIILYVCDLLSLNDQIDGR